MTKPKAENTKTIKRTLTMMYDTLSFVMYQNNFKKIDAENLKKLKSGNSIFLAAVAVKGDSKTYSLEYQSDTAEKTEIHVINNQNFRSDAKEMLEYIKAGIVEVDLKELARIKGIRNIHYFISHINCTVAEKCAELVKKAGLVKTGNAQKCAEWQTKYTLKEMAGIYYGDKIYAVMIPEEIDGDDAVVFRKTANFISGKADLIAETDENIAQAVLDKYEKIRSNVKAAENISDNNLEASEKTDKKTHADDGESTETKSSVRAAFERAKAAEEAIKTAAAALPPDKEG